MYCFNKTWTRISILLPIFILMICQIGSSYIIDLQSYATNKITHKYVQNILKPKNLFSFNQLPDPKAEIKHNMVDESSAFTFTDYHKYNYNSNIAGRLNTSCGNVTCSNISYYPLKLVKKIYNKYFRNKTQNINAGNRHLYNRSRLEVTPAKAKFKAEDCSKMVDISYPQESVDENNNPHIICTLQPRIDFGPKASECMVQKYCEDANTPINSHWHCGTKYIWRKECTVNRITEEPSTTRIRIANGCECKLKRKY